MLEFLTPLAPIVGLLAPILVYLASRQRLTHDKDREEHAEENTLWERMASMLDRYGQRMTELEEKCAAHEERQRQMANEFVTIKGQLGRWRAYALALVRQVKAAGVEPLSPIDFGLGDND